MDRTAGHPLLERTQAGRAEAAAVVRSLLDARALGGDLLGRRLRQNNERVRALELAIDNAIASAQRLVEALDRTLDGGAGGLDAEDLELLETHLGGIRSGGVVGRVIDAEPPAGGAPGTLAA
ncbi:MAG: hypothetical protein AAFR38_01060 [Planctomycetota bacterium]